MSRAASLREVRTFALPTPSLAQPTSGDGADVWKLIKQTQDLDDNSMYCNLLQCTDFAATSVIARHTDDGDGAKSTGAIAGWMSGYVPPARPDTLFVWQICVAPSARGAGLGKKLVHHVLARPALVGIKNIQSTITPDNDRSWGLFRSLAKDLDAPMGHQDHFDGQAHFGGAHESELLVTIGPF